MDKFQNAVRLQERARELQLQFLIANQRAFEKVKPLCEVRHIADTRGTTFSFDFCFGMQTPVWDGEETAQLIRRVLEQKSSEILRAVVDEAQREAAQAAKDAAPEALELVKEHFPDLLKENP